MYAIFENDGRQYWVEPEEIIRVEGLNERAGEEIEFDKVLAVNDDGDIKVGQPYVSDANIKATVIEHGRGAKIRVFTYKSKKHYKRNIGHRQNYTAIKIDEISV